MDIGPGDVVECVSYLGLNRALLTPAIGPGLTVGALYTVEHILPSDDGKDAFILVEIQDRSPSGRRYSYCPSCFRKRPPERTELFRSLLENPKILEDASSGRRRVVVLAVRCFAFLRSYQEILMFFSVAVMASSGKQAQHDFDAEPSVKNTWFVSP